jgi:hypothetical protein
MKYPPPIHLAAAAVLSVVLAETPPHALAQGQSPGHQILLSANEKPSTDNPVQRTEFRSQIPEKWSNAIAQLSNSNRKQRVKAFNAIQKMLPAPKNDPPERPDLNFADSVAQLDPAITDRLKTALIQTLALEQKLHLPKQSNSEGLDDDYYRLLVLDVAGIADERALPLLVRELSAGEIVGRDIARLGPRAVGPIITEGDEMMDDELNRSSCPGELAEMLRTKAVTLENNPAQYDLIKAAALHWTSLPVPEIRDADVLLLEQINDPDTIAAIRTLAANDPESEKGSDGVVHHLVRESAQAALDRLGGMAGKGYIDRP